MWSKDAPMQPQSSASANSGWIGEGGKRKKEKWRLAFIAVWIACGPARPTLAHIDIRAGIWAPTNIFLLLIMNSKPRWTHQNLCGRLGGEWAQNHDSSVAWFYFILFYFYQFFRNMRFALLVHRVMINILIFSEQNS